MHNRQLAIVERQGWRFCDIAPQNGQPTKGPRTPGWQNRPLTLREIPDGHNVGVITGELSQGILAVDFDGTSSWQVWLDNVGVPFSKIDTVTWSSGRENRAQMAFRVPEELWSFLPNKLQIMGTWSAGSKSEQLEFRWRGCQSVLPPSVHPELGTEYQWLRSPDQLAVQEAPVELLELIIKRTQVQEQAIAETMSEVGTMTTATPEEVRDILMRIKQANPTLSYELWTRVTWATVSVLGKSAGVALLKGFWPEERSGEYARLLKNYDPVRSPKLGSLMHLVRETAREQQMKRRQDYLNSLEEMREIRRRLKGLKGTDNE